MKFSCRQCRMVEVFDVADTDGLPVLSTQLHWQHGIVLRLVTVTWAMNDVGASLWSGPAAVGDIWCLLAYTKTIHHSLGFKFDEMVLHKFKPTASVNDPPVTLVFEYTGAVLIFTRPISVSVGPPPHTHTRAPPWSFTAYATFPLNDSGTHSSQSVLWYSFT